MHIVYWPLIRYIVHHWGTTHQQLILWATRSPVRNKALKKKMSVKSFDEWKPWDIKSISLLRNQHSWSRESIIVQPCYNLLPTNNLILRQALCPSGITLLLKLYNGNSRTYNTYSFMPADSVWNLVTLLLTGWLCRDELLECFRGEVDEAFVDADNDDTDLDSWPADLRV